MVLPLWKTAWRSLKKLKIELPHDPEAPLLGISRNDETLIQKDTGTPVFTTAPLTTAQTRQQPECPSTDAWMKKMCCLYTNTMEYYSGL